MLYFDDEPKPQSKRSNPLQTAAARAASHSTRSARDALKIVNRHKLAVFAVRLSGSTYGWELRHLGGIVHHRSVESFPSIALAQAGG